MLTNCQLLFITVLVYHLFMQITDFQQIIRSPTLAYEEGLNFFEGRGMLNETLRRLTDELEKNGIDYAVIRAIALNQHGYQRFTVDIDLLLTREGLAKVHELLVGRGYRPAFEGEQKKFRATERNIPIEVITTGEYPGDGKPKPISFPDPKDSHVIINGIKTITLEMLINLKLASGMTDPGRLKDLADVQELIKLKGLAAPFIDKLHPYVKEKFLELHRGAIQSRESEEIENF
jgi:hypothetical protein